MKRNKIVEVVGQDKVTDAFEHDKTMEHKTRIAYHEAGHAAGIHLYNKSIRLPPVFFKILFTDMGSVPKAGEGVFLQEYDDCIARIIGGRLIKLLPSSVDKWAQELAPYNDSTVYLRHDYMTAFNADIINLLIGPLAEAKYVAEADGEQFNRWLVNLNALANYGGYSDIAMINEYLQSFSTDEKQQQKKLKELFDTAFDFISNDQQWKAITELAGYILNCSKNIIQHEEICLTLDQSVVHSFSKQKNLHSEYL